MKRQTIIALAVIGVLLVATIGVTFAYFASSSQNDDAGINAETEELGSILLEGTKVFTSYDLLPGQMGVQEFTIEKNSDTGNGIYEIDLEAIVPEEFRSDIEILLYKTTDPDTNNVTVNVADPTLEDEMIYQSDSLNITGTPELIYQGTLTENPQIILEQADFDVTALEKTTYYLVYHYKNNGNQDDQQGKTFTGMITVRLINEKSTDYKKCVEQYGEDNPQCNILAQVDTTGKCPTVNADGTVDINGTVDDGEFASGDDVYEAMDSLAETGPGYVCNAPDDYGTSYYYRGDVENNWVKFADAYWRIVRVNGDGSIRVVYAGDANTIDALPNKAEVLQNGYDDSDTEYTQIGGSAYNSSSIDNAYVGYMYGTPGSSSYEETHANINDSTIKQYIDQWYKTNIVDKGYSEYVSDTLFCNDRSIKPTDSFNIDGDDSTQLGYGQNRTNYRMGGDPFAAIMSKVPGMEMYSVLETYPTYQCSQQNDRFTVSSGIGNGDLTYPIALLTADEVLLAGGYAASNYNYYLYTGNYYWTMSPLGFNHGYAYVRSVGDDGGAYGDVYVDRSHGVRPALNLKSGSLKSGQGTANEPFLV